MSTKRYYAKQGIVASANLKTIYQREIFFQVDPLTLDWMDYSDVKELYPSGLHIEVNPITLFPFLPELEAEIFWLIYFKKKNQKDIASLLKLSQPTVSYRYRRSQTKLAYLMTLQSIDPKGLIASFFFLKDKEKEILFDLLFYTNQEMVGQKHNVRQSSVKWIFVKSKRRITEMEKKDPDQWSHHLGLMLLLEKHLNIRVLHL